MTETLKVKRYNPVSFMQSDDEVIDFLVDCYREDKEGLTLARGLSFAEDALGAARAARLMLFAGIKIGRSEKRERRAVASVEPRMAL